MARRICRGVLYVVVAGTLLAIGTNLAGDLISGAVYAIGLFSIVAVSTVAIVLMASLIKGIGALARTIEDSRRPMVSGHLTIGGVRHTAWYRIDQIEREVACVIHVPKLTAGDFRALSAHDAILELEDGQHLTCVDMRLAPKVIQALGPDGCVRVEEDPEDTAPAFLLCRVVLAGGPLSRIPAAPDDAGGSGSFPGRTGSLPVD